VQPGTEFDLLEFIAMELRPWEKVIQGVLAVFAAAVSFAIFIGLPSALLVWKYYPKGQHELGFRLPELVDAPSDVDQEKLIAAIKKYPETSVDIVQIVPLGAKAADLKTLLAAFGEGATIDGITYHQIELESKFGSLGRKCVVLQIAGNPARVIRRGIELQDNY
jgi:hypothetical protein